MENARKKSEVRTDAAMPCKSRMIPASTPSQALEDPKRVKLRQAQASKKFFARATEKEKLFMHEEFEAHEPGRKRMRETHNRYHEDHIGHPLEGLLWK